MAYAAGQIKSSTGGGIVQGLKAAQALTECVLNGKDYDKEWRKALSKDLWMHLKIRKYLDRFDDSDYDRLVSMLNPEVRSILENYSRDNPSRFAVKLLLKQPRFLYFMKKLIS